MVARRTDEEHRSATALGAVLRPVLRGRGGPSSGRAAPSGQRRPHRRRRHLVLPGVLRGVVGVDELHLVRLGLRHRRHRLSRNHTRADRRSSRLRRGRAPGDGPPRLRRGHPRLRDHAAGDGHPMASCRAVGCRTPPGVSALRRRRDNRADRLGRASRSVRAVGHGGVRACSSLRSCACRSMRSASP